MWISDVLNELNLYHYTQTYRLTKLKWDGYLRIKKIYYYVLGIIILNAKHNYRSAHLTSNHAQKVTHFGKFTWEK